MISTIIVAGGKGERFDADIPKQFFKLVNGKMIIELTIEKFENNNNIGEIVLVASPQYIDFLKTIVNTNGFKKVKAIATGGKTRQDSVGNGLKEIVGDYVFVHDGVRPFISQKEINDLSKLVRERNAVINCTKVKDTIKITKDNFIVDTPNRELLYAASTPQCFKTEILRNAHLEANKISYFGTDEADIVEKINEKVYIYEGSYQNIKITTKLDLIIGNEILRGDHNGTN